MDKKGFVKTIEAIIAVVVIFGAILFILPKSPPLAPGEMPPQLKITADALIEQIQNDELFRKCVLLANNDEINKKTNLECLNDFIDGALPPFNPWNYGFTICTLPQKLKDSLETAECVGYVGNKDDREFDEEKAFSSLDLFENELPGGNIYTRRILVSVDDVTAIPIGGNLKEYKAVTLFFWE